MIALSRRQIVGHFSKLSVVSSTSCMFKNRQEDYEIKDEINDELIQMINNFVQRYKPIVSKLMIGGNLQVSDAHLKQGTDIIYARIDPWLNKSSTQDLTPQNIINFLYLKNILKVDERNKLLEILDNPNNSMAKLLKTQSDLFIKGFSNSFYNESETNSFNLKKNDKSQHSQNSKFDRFWNNFNRPIESFEVWIADLIMTDPSLHPNWTKGLLRITYYLFIAFLIVAALTVLAQLLLAAGIALAIVSFLSKLSALAAGLFSLVGILIIIFVTAAGYTQPPPSQRKN